MALKKKEKAEKKDYKNRRYVASIWENQGDYGPYDSVAIDNHSPTKVNKKTKEEEDNKYFTGYLMWQDAETEKFYHIKSMNIIQPKESPEGMKGKLVIDLDNEYHVDELE